MQRILSGLGITGSQVMLASGCRAALAAAAAAAANAPAAMTDFRSGYRSRESAPRSIASAPSMRPQLMVPLILKLANFIGCPCVGGFAVARLGCGRWGGGGDPGEARDGALGEYQREGGDGAND